MEQNYWGKDPGKTINGIAVFLVIVSFVVLFVGVAFVSASEPSRALKITDASEYYAELETYESKVQLGWVLISGGFPSLLITGIALICVSNCIEYRNDLIKQEITILQEVRKDIQSLKAKESSSDDQSNPETAQTESSDNL